MLWQDIYRLDSYTLAGDHLEKMDMRTFREVDLSGGTVVESFPTVGMVSSIACTYLISTLKMDQVCAIDDDEFPPLSMVYARKPKFPARVYAHDEKKFAAFLCEVPIPGRVHRKVARCLLDWAKKHEVRRIVSLEGLPLPEGESKDEIQVWGVGSTDRAREDLEKAGINQLESGMISGVSGVLLNEGRWEKFDTIALLAEARASLPDAHAAAKLVRAVDDLLPEIEVDLEPLLTEAKELETQLLSLKAQAKPALSEPLPGMFR
jgi:uncharacterized protein